MRFPQQQRAFRLCAAAGLAAALVVTVGCDGGSDGGSTPAQVQQIQKNESEARQKAFGKMGRANVNSAKASKSLAPAADAAPPADAAAK
jgi:hypothetical protein